MANQYVQTGEPRDPEKDVAHPQAELSLSHMCSMWAGTRRNEILALLMTRPPGRKIFTYNIIAAN